MINQRLVMALGGAVQGADVAEQVGLVGQVTDVTVDGERPPVRGKPFLETALVVIDGAYVVIQDCLVLRAADLPEYLQRLLISNERITVISARQLHPGQ